MIKTIFAIVVFFFASITAFGQEDSEYSNTLKKMFEVSGTEASYQTAIKQMISMFKHQYPDVKAEIWMELEEEFLKTSMDELTEMLVPVYYKYMSIGDLQDIIKFYESPAGLKFAESTPLIMEESMQIGQAWGMKLGQEFTKRMEEKGF
ncbi:DUF2059 domain-containing protein [Alkalitalea saponilacus]|uniref:DUF2059 domain-containing protein n=1 Tax=Alkalitalea saponilacus TaxID=889453 RepID=A0A1T5HMX4_9BACT|nr:DUF2059 domain-containing protein [Alkalitalea saponilacus]ASB49371.1 hypothetical protein CDL62_09575 [Alkalitalea saponilacus]SKC22033.1 hypothetical protein SAMN03080601_02493 [Alkalitalea saponilacus]